MEHQAAKDTNAVERYLLGEMPVDERDAFENHYFSCIACAEEVREGAQLRANWAGAEQKTFADHKKRWSAPLWLRWPSLVPVAASLVFAGVVWIQAGRAVDPYAYEEYTVQQTERGPNTRVAVIPKGDGPAEIRFELPAEAPPPPYECVIANVTGKPVAKMTMKGHVKPKEARVTVDREGLEAGLYTITLRSGADPVAQYSFQLQ